MKGEITLKILENLKNLAVEVGDLLAVLLASGYGVSYSKLEYELSKRQRQRNSKSVATEKEFRKSRIKYQKLIYSLKRDNLIKEINKNKKKTFLLTRKGKNKLQLLKERRKKKLPSGFYHKEIGDKFVIIIFDIPEKERRKRDWLREVLKNLGLRMIQKSVWVGKVKIPKPFIDDLHKLKMIDFVEIFEIGKKGSLENLI